jgi:hypothetical protein
MANNAFGFVRLTGGTGGCLDDLIHTNISDGDFAVGIDKSTNKAYLLVYDSTNDNGTNPESTTEPGIVVVPDSNTSGTGAWVNSSLQSNTITGTLAGAASLYYALAAKLATTATGVSVTGKTTTTTLDVGGTVVITGTLDEDNMASNSDVSLCTQQSIKSYVDTQTSGSLQNVVEDTTPQLGGDLDLNGKNIDFPTTANISDCLDEDNMVSDSATALATQQSIKAYVDGAVGTPSGVGLDVSLADTTSSGLTLEATVDTNAFGAGALVMLAADGNWDTADASAEATCDSMLGIAVDSGTGASKTILVQGLYRLDATYAWTVGATLWASETTGAMTETKPSTSSAIQRIVGYAITADIIYFDPDKTYVEV